MTGTPRANRRDAASEPVDWFVFETFVADGSLAIGIDRGTPDPSAGMVVREGLTRRDAVEVARRLAEEYRESGRPPASPDIQRFPPDSADV